MKTLHTAAITLAVLLFSIHTYAAKTIEGKRIVETKEWTVKDGKKQKIDHISRYDKNGNKTEEIEYNKTGDQKSRSTYKYNENGKVVEEQVYNEFNKLEKTVKTEYNEYGKKASEKTYYPNGKLKSEHIFEYILER